MGGVDPGAPPLSNRPGDPVTPSHSLTFDELRSFVEDAFISPPVSTADLVNAALSSHAHPAVFAGLRLLPEQRYASIDEVWSFLSEPRSTSSGTDRG